MILGLGDCLLSVEITAPPPISSPQFCAGVGSFLGELWARWMDALGDDLPGGLPRPHP